MKRFSKKQQTAFSQERYIQHEHSLQLDWLGYRPTIKGPWHSTWNCTPGRVTSKASIPTVTRAMGDAQDYRTGSPTHIRCGAPPNNASTTNNRAP